MLFKFEIVSAVCFIVCACGFDTKNILHYDGPDEEELQLAIKDFVELVEKTPEEMCKFITCEEALSKDNCPDGTQYVENISQFGCCGSCVRYAGENEACTGSVDELYGGGYGYYVDNGDSVSKRSKKIEKTSSDTTETNVVQDLWCDYHLACGNSKKCEQDPAPDKISCRQVQLTYDDDILLGHYERYRDEYRWRPDCDDKGYYSPKQCKGSTEEEQICVCVDKNGNSIYGKAFPWQTDIYEDMNCLCSRLYSELAETGESVTLHCKENGNFDPLQCDRDWCLCVNETTGAPVSEVFPQNSITLLPCFNITTEGAMYLRKCDSEYHAQEELQETLKGHSINLNPSSQTECDPDGSYAARYCDGADCSCVDKYNNYLVAPSPEDTDCNCIRDQNTYSNAGRSYGLKCDITAPGTYQQYQQLGEIIYCVDSDGVRNGPKLRSECLDNLYCEMAVRCQTQGYDSCISVCDPECPEDAYYYSDDFVATGDCTVE